MVRSLPNHSASRTRTRRLAYASALAGLALAGVVGLGLPHTPVQAQLKPESSIHCDALVSLPKSVLTDRLATLAPSRMRALDHALRVALSLA